jgi:hypothetical protein
MSSPESKTIQEFIRSSVQQTFTMVISLSSIVITSEVLLRVAKPMRGRSTADVGIIIFENSSGAWAFWLSSFLAASGLILFIVKLTISRNSNLPYWGIPAAMSICLIHSYLVINW